MQPKDIMKLSLGQSCLVWVIALIVVAILFSLSGCAGGQGGQQPKLNPQKAQTYAQPTIPGRQPVAAPQSQATLEPLIKEKPIVIPATSTPEPFGVVDYEQDVLDAQKLLNDCIALTTREAVEGWLVDCKLLYENLEKANKRLNGGGNE